MEIKGQTAYISGGASGLGEATARLLAQAGATVILSGRRVPQLEAVAERIADDNMFPAFKSKFNGEISEGRLANQKVALLKPQTYMNESGQGIGRAAKFYKIPPERIVVFHDELDLNAGKVRVKNGGGVAGHNGLKSARAHLGTAEFLRVRLGIGHPGDRGAVSGYVLSDFAKSEQGWLERLVPSVARRIDILLGGKADEFMSRVADDVKD